MYTVDNDSRIFMTPVLDYDVKARRYVFAPDGKELVFQNVRKLILHLAFHTDTHEYADPARWSNDLIPRQFPRGRAARIWNVKYTSVCAINTHTYYSSCEKTENWDYWFHDAYGRTIDVRGFWPDVIATVRRGNMAKAKPSPQNRGHRQGRKTHGGGRMEMRHARGKAKAGAYLHDFFEKRIFCDEEDNPVFQWTPRGKLLTTARFLRGEWDAFDDRSGHSTGWKDHKCRHQWEHRVREQERHRKNRERKLRRLGYDNS